MESIFAKSGTKYERRSMLAQWKITTFYVIDVAWDLKELMLFMLVFIRNPGLFVARFARNLSGSIGQVQTQYLRPKRDFYCWMTYAALTTITVNQQKLEQIER